MKNNWTNQMIEARTNHRPLPFSPTRRQRIVLKGREGALMRYVRVGASALANYNPNDKRTHPAVAKIIAERGDRAGFVVRDGILFQLTVGLFEDRGVCAYYPVRGASLTEIDRIAKCFGVAEIEVPNIIFWGRK